MLSQPHESCWEGLCGKARLGGDICSAHWRLPFKEALMQTFVSSSPSVCLGTILLSIIIMVMCHFVHVELLSFWA